MSCSGSYLYQVEQIKPLTDKVIQVFLSPEETLLPYRAGQYIEIVLDENNARPFSIANAPLGARLLEFHIRHATDDPFLEQLLEAIRSQHQLKIRGPLGKMTYSPGSSPLLFVAGGTGFAPLKAIIEDILARGDNTPMHLFWGATTASDLYLDEIPQHWQQHVAHFDYTPVLSNPSPHDNWQGKTGLLQEVVAQYYTDLSQHQIYCAGPAKLVSSAFESFKKLGLIPQHMHADLLP